jgi:hypothetical protein
VLAKNLRSRSNPTYSLHRGLRTSIQEYVDDDSKEHDPAEDLRQGWLYFSNPAFNAVTDQDVRDPQALEVVEQAMIEHYPLGTFGEGMEIHLFNLHPHSAGKADATPGLFNLVVNHQSCVASYDADEVTSDSVLTLSPARRECDRL